MAMVTASLSDTDGRKFPPVEQPHKCVDAIIVQSLYLALFINNMDGHGFSNKAHSEHLLKQSKVML